MLGRIAILLSVIAGIAVLALPSSVIRVHPVANAVESAEKKLLNLEPTEPNAPNLAFLKDETNFHLVDFNRFGFALYRSAKPSREAIRAWCSLGISEVMVLSGDADSHEESFREECPNLKVVYDTPQSESVPVDAAFLQKFDSWIAEAKRDHKKVLFRCLAGAHRTGRLGAYYAMKYQNFSFDDAVTLMIQNGKDMDNHQQLPDQVAALQDYIQGKPCRFSGEAAELNCVRN